MALTWTWAHRWVCLGPSLVSGCGCPGCSFLFHHPKSACLSSLLSTTCMKYVFHAREQRWELALPATGARIQPETRKAGNALLLGFLAKKILRPRNSRRSGTEPLGTGAELGRAYVRISFPFTLLPSCLAMISSLALKEIHPKALKNLCCCKQPFIIFPFI